MDYEARQGEAGAAPVAAAAGARPKKLFYGYILIPVLGFMSVSYTDLFEYTRFL